MLEMLAISEEEVRGLEALARAELRLALAFTDRAEAAEDADEAVKLSRAAQKSGRGYRQILALKVRLARELKRQAKDDRADEVRDHQRDVSHRQAQVRAAVKGLIWTTEREDEEAERLDDALLDLLSDDALAEDFLEVPLHNLVARLCHDLDLPLPAEASDAADPSSAHPREGGDPSGLATAPAFESSA